MNFTKTNTTPYHPQCDGLVERFNKTIMDMLSMFTNSRQTDWDTYIQYVLFAYRSSQQESTQCSPFLLMYGREPNMPIDIALRPPTYYIDDLDDYKTYLLIRMRDAWKVARQRLENAQQRQSSYYDRRHYDPSFSSGDKVWLYNPAVPKGKTHKLIHLWHGPFTIISIRHPNVVIEPCMGRNRKQQTVHINRLKRYRGTVVPRLHATPHELETLEEEPEKLETPVVVRTEEYSDSNPETVNTPNLSLERTTLSRETHTAKSTSEPSQRDDLISRQSRYNLRPKK